MLCNTTIVRHRNIFLVNIFFCLKVACRSQILIFFMIDILIDFCEFQAVVKNKNGDL